MKKDSVEIDIEDGINSPVLVGVGHQKLRTRTNIHHSDARYDHISEIKHRKVLQNGTYSGIQNTGDTKEGKWRYKHDNNEMANAKRWSTSWGSKSASNGGTTNTGNGGQWSWSTLGGQTSASGSAGNAASGSSGGLIGQASGGGYKGGVTRRGSVSAGNIWSQGNNVGGTIGNLGGVASGKMGGAVGGNIGTAGGTGHQLGIAAGGMNMGFGGAKARGVTGGMSSAGGGMSLNLGRTGNDGFLSANGKFVFSQSTYLCVLLFRSCVNLQGKSIM